MKVHSTAVPRAFLVARDGVDEVAFPSSARSVAASSPTADENPDAPLAYRASVVCRLNRARRRHAWRVRLRTPQGDKAI